MTGNSAMNLQNRVTGNRLAIILAMLFILQVGEKSYAWQFISRTPEIRGKIVDATTGEPIENVIVACGWQKSVPSFGGDITRSFTGEVYVTGKDGRYKIPAKTTFHLYSKFHGTMIQIVHPLYETKLGYGDSKGVGFSKTESGKASSDGIVHLDMRLMGVGERYLGEEGKNDGKLYLKLLEHFGSHENAWYWLILREKNIPFDIDETFKVWDNVAIKVFGEKSVFYTYDYLLAKSKIKEKLEGDKK